MYVNDGGGAYSVLAIDGGDLACLALLNLSTSFNTIGQEGLLDRLKISYGVYMALRGAGFAHY
jgi:hypothetical protein